MRLMHLVFHLLGLQAWICTLSSLFHLHGELSLIWVLYQDYYEYLIAVRLMPSNLLYLFLQ